MPQEDQRDITAITLSFVAPVHNEADGLEAFYNQLRDVAEDLGDPYEIILVDDGSTDKSPQIMQRLHEADDHVKYVTLSRNFGHQEALTAGYDYAAGAAVVTLDSDCQHPPEMIPQLVSKWREGYEVVYTVKARDPNVSALRRLTVKSVYKLIAWCTGTDVADQADFRLLDRKVVDVIRRTREKCRFLRGLVRWVGFRQIGVEYEPAPRLAGTASYTLAKLARMGSAGLFNFSVTPLRTIGVVGGLMLALAVVYGLFALLLWPFVGPSLVANLVFFAIGLVGLQMGMMGLMAEYIGRMYEEAKDRPIYIAREAVGFGEDVREEVERIDAPSRPAPAPAEPGKIRLFT